MLPGFRFLFVAIVLFMSVLIFGFGAAALLRSAHEEFVNLPNMRPQPEAVFAQQTRAPMLAMLRLDPPVAAQNDIDRSAVANLPDAPQPEQQSPTPSTATEPDGTTTAPDLVATLPAAVPPEKSELSESPAPTETPVDGPAPPLATEAAATPVPTSSAAAVIEAPTAAPEPLRTPADDSAKAASAKIATLGGPAVTIEPETAPKVAPSAKPRRPAKRRRISLRPPPQDPIADSGLFGPPSD